MPRMTTPLNANQLKQAKPKAKEYSLMDGGGLALRVKPNGSKLWVFNYYRPYTKKRANLSLGRYPDMSLAYARRERDKAKALLAQNIDPKQHRDLAHQSVKNSLSNTLEAIARQWLIVKRTKVSEDHANKLFRSLELHVFPALGNTPIHEIRAPSTIDILKPLAAKGSLETVKRVCQRLNEVMYYAVNSGLIENNPLARISDVFEAPKKQHMPTLKPEQLPSLLQAIAVASIKRTTRCLIEWQMHTMVRPGEAAGTRWEEVDLENKLWTIPAHRMKKKKEHIIPISSHCVALLEVMRPISGHRDYVFPSDRNPRTHTNASTANVALKRMGYHKELVSHGLRALASTILNEQGFDPDIIETALAHSDKNEVRKAYNRAQYLQQRRAMMQWWSDHIEQAATGSLSMTNGIKNLRAI